MLAAANLFAGLVISSWPERQNDLGNMRRWTRYWLVDRQDIYTSPEVVPTYPPHAIVALSPLGLLPTRVLVPLWAAGNLILAVWTVFGVVRVFVRLKPDTTYGVEPDAMYEAVPDRRQLMLMLLCWGAFRTLLQFTLLSMAFGLAAMRSASRRPYWSGVLLGLALIKPQVAAPFVLWALFTRRFRSLAVAGAVVFAGLMAYCVRASVNPARTVVNYADILRRFYLDDEVGLVGFAQVRPLMGSVFSNQAATLVSSIVALSLLGAIGWLGAAAGKRREVDVSVVYAAPALAGIWSLMTFYHLTYGAVLLLPAAVLLRLEPAALARPVFWMMQLLLMFDPATIWRWFGGVLPLGRFASSAGALLAHADRVWMALLFAAIMTFGVKAVSRAERA
jgi:hypothetical protein